MLFHYCIPSVDQLSHFCNDYGYAQITLNSRIFPSKRNLLKHLDGIPDDSLIVHYDYIYIISRYPFFSASVKSAILDELHSLLTSPKIRGVVMHVDFPLRKDVVKNPTIDVVKEYYSKSLYDFKSVVSILNGVCVLDFLSLAVGSFFKDYVYRFGIEDLHSKIYLENTTKIYSHFINHGTVDNLFLLLTVHPEYQKLFGICIDTEHDYAVTGRFITNFSVYQAYGIDFMIHLNTIPSSVLPKKCLDRHSETTVHECSINPFSVYFSIANTYKDIDIIREVTYETMQRECLSC